MADTNYLSFQELEGARKTIGELRPSSPRMFDDTLKVWRCNHCIFQDGDISGGREDCIDVGRESSENVFERLRLYSNGQYCCTIKGGSHYNVFSNIVVVVHGDDVDFEFGNWHSYNFEPSRGNALVNVTATDGRPVTYCYRFFGCKPQIIDSHVRHLWWRSLGLTLYWWAKYISHVLLKRKDNMGK